MKKVWIRALCALAVLAMAVGGVLLAVNGHVKRSVRPYLLSAEEAAKTPADCILVLGCGVRPTGEPSLMLRDRLDMGLKLYELGAAPKLLMSGDHGSQEYDEVNVMKDYAMTAGVVSEDVFMDHAGFSTYESVYRAKAIFQAKKIIIVTQKYHLHRALYIAKAMGLDAYGVSCDTQVFSGQFHRDVREILARNKDFFTSIFKPKPTYLGDPVPVSGNGNLNLP